DPLGCTDASAFNYDANAICDDGSCIATVNGCTDPTACNYDASANTDNGECNYATSSITDITACDSVVWNGTTYNSSGTYSYSNSASNNYSMSFDNNGEYLNSNVNTTSSQDATWMGWFYFDDLIQNGMIAQNNGYNTNGYFINTSNIPGSQNVPQTSVYLSTAIGNTNQLAQTWTNANAITSNQWHHVAISLSNGIASIYIDGLYNVAGNNFNHQIQASSADFLIGTGTDLVGSLTQVMNGDIDDVQIWNTALSQQEIQQYMICPPTGNESGLVGYWNFEDNSNPNIALDVTGNGNDGTINGATYDNNVHSQSCALTNANGCDSTAILNLTINQGDTSYTSITACDSVVWNGTTYDSSGTYYHYVNNSLSLLFNDSLLIDQFTMTVNSYFSHTLPLFDSTKTYRIFADGRYGYADGWSHNDACYNYAWDTINGIKVNCNGSQHAQKSIAWLYDGVSDFQRPDNDLHNNCCFCNGNDKTYFWTIAGDNNTHLLEWIDGGGYGDNSGSLNFYVYEMQNPVNQFTTTNGCDSTAILNLTINQADTSYTNITACDSLVWNGTTYNQSGTYSYSGNTGSNNYSMSFDGNGDYVELSNAIAFGTNSFTVSIDCYLNAFKGSDNEPYSYIVGTPLAGASNDHGFKIQTSSINNNGGFEVHINDAGTTYFNVISYNNTIQTNVILNKWYNLTMVVDRINNIFQFYVDGSLVGSQSISNSFGDVDLGIPISIGHMSLNNTSRLDGLTDNLHIWNTVLTQQEIQQYMTCPPTGPESGLVGYWNFEQGSGTTAYDQTSNGNNGTINGATYDINIPSQSCALTNANGCDSTAILNLTINNPTSSYLSVSECEDYTWSVNNVTYSTSGLYIDSSLNVDGCIHVDSLSLLINYSDSSTDIQVHCDEYTWIDGNIYTSSISTATHMFQTANGCDSLSTLDLTINYSITTVDSLTICEGDSFGVGTNVYTLNGNYIDTLTTINGCDSIINTAIAIIDTDIIQNDTTICSGDSVVLDVVDLLNNSTGSNFSILDSYVDLPDPIINDEPEFTITALVKAPDYQTQSSSIYRQINGGETTLRIESGSIIFQCKASYGNCFTSGGWVYLNAPIPDNDWHSYTAVYNRNAGYMELYIDGNLEVTTGVNNGSLANCNLYSAQIGESGHSMYVDELAIFDYAQSASEIQSYNCNSLDGSENGLLAYWNLNEGSGSFVFDITNNFNGVLFGSYSTDNACNSSATLDSIQWSTGDTTTSIIVSPSQTTTYWVTQTVNGVSCSDSVTITVNQPTYSTTTITECDSVVWNGTTYNSTGVYTWNGTNSLG
ncbi:LamG domain-containing protein, partial [Flavobacteriales bacterium]|nr:LamG domain-containing protein [Flavobacteriales bacterium]